MIYVLFLLFWGLIIFEFTLKEEKETLYNVKTDVPVYSSSFKQSCKCLKNEEGSHFSPK